MSLAQTDAKKKGIFSIFGDAEDVVTRVFVGGIAGATAKTIVAPLDRVKIIFQISNMPFSFRGVAKEMSHTVKNEGWRALFRGNAAQVLRVYPYSGIQLMSFDKISKLILNHKKKAMLSESSALDVSKVRLSPFERVLAGASAGAVSVACTYPLDLMRARLAVQRETADGQLKYRGLKHAFQQMWSKNNIREFYKGIGPTMLGILPYAGISFATYETCKQFSVDRTGAPVNTFERLFYGGIAGLAGQAVTYPLDIVRRRMQTEGYTNLHAHCSDICATNEAKRSTHTSNKTPIGSLSRTVMSKLENVRVAHGSILDVLMRVMRREGLRGLFKGLSMNLVKGPIAVGVSFTTYDLLKRALGIEGLEH